MRKEEVKYLQVLEDQLWEKLGNTEKEYGITSDLACIARGEWLVARNLLEHFNIADLRVYFVK